MAQRLRRKARIALSDADMIEGQCKAYEIPYTG